MPEVVDYASKYVKLLFCDINREWSAQKKNWFIYNLPSITPHTNLFFFSIYAVHF